MRRRMTTLAVLCAVLFPLLAGAAFDVSAESQWNPHSDSSLADAEECVAGRDELCVRVDWSVTSAQGNKETAQCEQSAQGWTGNEESCQDDIYGTYIVQALLAPPGQEWRLVSDDGLENDLYIDATVTGLLDNPIPANLGASYARAEMTNAVYAPTFYIGIGPQDRQEIDLSLRSDPISVDLAGPQSGVIGIPFSGELHNRVYFGAGINTFVLARSMYVMSPVLAKTTTWIKYEYVGTTACLNTLSLVPSGNGNIVWAGLDSQNENDWHAVTPQESGRMLLAVENSEVASTTVDYELKVWDEDCRQLVATAGHQGKGRGERVILNVQPGNQFRTRVYGRTPDDFESGALGSDYYEAVHVGNINGILQLVGAPTTKYTPPQGPDDPAGGTLEISATFRNVSAGAKARELRSLTFELDRLTNNNEFVSGRTGTGAFIPTDPPLGGGSVMYAVQNWDLPAETMQFIPGLDPNEAVGITFRIALANRNSFDFAVNVFAIPFDPGSAVVPAAADAIDADFSGPSFAFSITEEMLQAESAIPLYLPFLQH